MKTTINNLLSTSKETLMYQKTLSCTDFSQIIEEKIQHNGKFIAAAAQAHLLAAKCKIPVVTETNFAGMCRIQFFNNAVLINTDAKFLDKQAELRDKLAFLLTEVEIEIA